MKQILLVGVFVSIFIGCTKYNSIDTGLAQKKFTGNMYEYFHSNSYDWDSLLILIDYTGLKDYFTGEKEGYERITFFGPTNNSLRRWMYGFKSYDNMGNAVYTYHSIKEAVDGIGLEKCKNILLSHIVKGKFEVKDIPRGTGSDNESGVVFTGGSDNTFRVYSFRETYNGVAETGAIRLYIMGGINFSTAIDVASTDIEPENGIVHSLAYGYIFGQLTGQTR